MQFLAPPYVVVGLVAGGLVAAMHLLARSRPRRRTFPTARFVPDVTAAAAALSRTPSDWLLLLLRVAAVLAISMALAQPHLGTRPSRHTIVAVLGWRAAAPDDLVESARAVWRPGDLLLAVGDTTRPVGGIDELASLRTSEGRTTASAAILGALEIAREHRGTADSFELVLVTPVVRDVWDAATSSIRSAWQGGITVVPVRPREPAPPRIAAIDATLDEALVAGLELVGVADPAATVRVRSAAPTAGDSVWVASQGGVVLSWPPSPEAPGDSALGVTASGIAFVELVARVSLGGEGRAVAHFLDGTIAAIEWSLGAGCIREAGFVMPSTGDAVLRPAALGVLRELSAPCGGWPDVRPLPPEAIQELRGKRDLLVAASLSAPSRTAIPADPVWLIVALLFLGAEMVVRQKTRG